MTRIDMTRKLIQDELIWLHENYSASHLDMVTRFFLTGGFDHYTDDTLLKLYNDKFLEV